MKLKRDSKVPIDKEHNHILEKIGWKKHTNIEIKISNIPQKKNCKRTRKIWNMWNKSYFLLISIILGLYILMEDAMNEVDML